MRKSLIPEKLGLLIKIASGNLNIPPLGGMLLTREFFSFSIIKSSANLSKIVIESQKKPGILEKLILCDYFNNILIIHL